MFRQVRKIFECICKPADVIFKIIAVTTNPITQRSKIRYQAIGKSVTTVDSVENIFESLANIQGFSESEAQHIIKRYQFEQTLPDLAISEIIFDDACISFTIRDQISLSEFLVTAEYFVENKLILNHFSLEDTERILTILFEMTTIKENGLIKKDKQNNKNKLQIVPT